MVRLAKRHALFANQLTSAPKDNSVKNNLDINSNVLAFKKKMLLFVYSETSYSMQC